MVYKIGQWKRSTLITLERVKEENNKGIHPKAASFRNGAISSWLTILKENGYLDNGDGYHLNSKGECLLEELRKNPPKSIRKNSIAVIHNTPDSVVSIQNNSFVIEIKGKNNFNVKSVINDATEEKILRALAAFKEELR